MKNLLLLLIGLLAFSVTAEAQNAKSMSRKAKRLVTSYNFNPVENKGDLVEAAELIEQVLQDPEGMADWDNFRLKGEIYNILIEDEIKMKIMNPNYSLKNPDAAIQAFEALKTAYEMAPKTSHKKRVLKHLQENENHLNNVAAYAFQSQDFQDAYENFARTLEAYEMFKAAESESDSRLADPEIMKEQYLFTGYAAYFGDNQANAKKYFDFLEKSGTDQPFVYEALFNIYSGQEDYVEALNYLQKGRDMFPDDAGLLYAEINHYIKEEKLDQLIGKLEEAIELDPENISVYTTMGSVYDQLHTKAYETGDTASMKQLFDNAMKYFNKALDIDPNNFDATYSIGALYYNTAATYTQEIQKLADDFSAAGTRKYKELNVKMLDLFSKAKPYFEKAYEINDKDVSVLQALSEIHARQDDLEKATYYRNKLEEVKAEQGL